jgi:serine/threonine protein kinase
MSIYLFLKEKDKDQYYHLVNDTLKTVSGQQYEVTDRISAGGNAVVHRCLDSNTGEEYAIKFQLDHRSNRLKRFSQEQTLLQRLQHEHLINYHGHGQVESLEFVGKKSKQSTVPFVVMELAEETLFIQAKNKNFSSEIYFAQFRGLAKALAVLHQHAIHRDIKPDNILISGERWLLSDYGLCAFLDDDKEQLTKLNEIVGPRFWMSPEANNRSVGREDEIDKSSDVFQLAAVFWFVINKTHPTGVLTKNDWQGPEKLFEPIFKALHYDKNIRPKDAYEFSEQIEEAIYS